MNIKNVTAFILGGLMGSAITWFYIKNKYEQIAQEEIDSVKAVYAVKKRTTDSTEHKEQKENVINDLDQYDKILNKNKYVGVSGDVPRPPYIIAPDEFGDFEDYDRISLYYYTDGILADTDDEMIEDINETIGIDSLNHFGGYEEDCVYVRNEMLRCDYEILKDYRSYAEVIAQKSPNIIDGI